MANHSPSPALADNSPVDPHHLEAEQAILGSCLIDRELIVYLSALLTEDDFFIHAHKLIWRAMAVLWERRVPVDFVTLGAEIERMDAIADIGGEAYLVECFAVTPSSVHANYYAEMVLEASERRRHLRAVQAVAGDVYDRELTAEQVHERALARMTAAARTRGERDAVSMNAIMGSAFDAVDDWDKTRFTLGVSEIDRILGGVAPGQMIVLAARPSMGKTAMGLQFAYHVAHTKRGVAVASFEMSAEDIGNRLVSFYADVNMHRFHSSRQYHDDMLPLVTEARGFLSELPIYVQRHGSGELGEFVVWAKRHHAERSFDLLVVDYVGLMSAKGHQNRTQEIGTITRALKVLAGELGIVVLALAQLNREIEHRRDQSPVLSDLRDSGTLEQDADIVIFLHRPERDADTLVSIAKHRSGPIGDLHLAFEPARARFRSVQ